MSTADLVRRLRARHPDLCVTQAPEGRIEVDAPDPAKAALEIAASLPAGWTCTVVGPSLVLHR